MRQWVMTLTVLLSAGQTILAVAQDRKADVTVELRNIEFHPKRIKVKKGDTVRFTNQDKFDHDVYIVRTVNLKLVVVDVTRLKAGQDTYVPIKEDGVFDLYCTIHGGMEGKITTHGSFHATREERKKYEKAKAPVPAIARRGEALFWGRAQCYQCHRMGDRGKGVRGPDLKNIGLRAASRARDVGLDNGTAYIIQSILEPSRVLVEGYTNAMAIVYQPPIGLDAGELKAIVAYLQVQGGEYDDFYLTIPGAALKKDREIHPFKGGDPVSGEKVFVEAGQCIKCHTVGQRKSVASTGPDLTEIGRYRGWKWLAESIIDPSAEIGREWKSVRVALHNGTIVQGILREDTGENITIKVGPQQFRSIPKGKIRARKDSELSLMPGNYPDLLTFKQIRDLIAYLQGLKGEQGDGSLDAAAASKAGPENP